MAKYDALDEDLNEKVYLILEELFQEHDRYGPEFMTAIFLNGFSNVLAMYALNKESAHKIALNISEKILQSVDVLEEKGAFGNSEHVQ